MKTLIITGCNGQLGRAINKELEGSSEYKLVNTDVEELDITDVNAVLAFVREHKPYAIVPLIQRWKPVRQREIWLIKLMRSVREI